MGIQSFEVEGVYDNLKVQLFIAQFHNQHYTDIANVVTFPTTKD